MAIGYLNKAKDKYNNSDIVIGNLKLIYFNNANNIVVQCTLCGHLATVQQAEFKNAANQIRKCCIRDHCKNQATVVQQQAVKDLIEKDYKKLWNYSRSNKKAKYVENTETFQDTVLFLLEKHIKHPINIGLFMKQYKYTALTNYSRVKDKDSENIYNIDIQESLADKDIQPDYNCEYKDKILTAIQNVITDMSDELRNIINLHFYDLKSKREIADILKKSVKTIDRYVNAILTTIKNKLITNHKETLRVLKYV